jgi:proline iminopeptidase
MLRADDGVALWYQRVGEGPPVVFCHGGPGIADYLEPVQQIVADMVTVYRWDQRGSGRSDPAGPFTIARFVAHLEALRTHVGHEQWTLLGHSWGANLAIHYAQAHPARVRGIVYLCGTGLVVRR